MELRGRVALVTGGGRRVGRAIALSLARAGARVAVHYNESADGANDVVRTVEREGGEAWAIKADLRDAAAAEQLPHQVRQHFGAFDVLVNSAAIMLRTPVDAVTAEQWDDMFALNLRAPFFCARGAAAAMGQRGGVIVNIADLAGMEVWPQYIPHGVSKAGVLHLTRGLARVLAPAVRVNAVAPGSVLLPESWGADDAARLAKTTPLGRIGSPDDVTQAVLYLIAADYVTGDTIVVDGGRHVR